MARAESALQNKDKLMKNLGTRSSGMVDWEEEK